MLTDTSADLNLLPCMHRNITTVITGGMHFTQGDVWDDIRQELLCLDCGEYVTEAEVRERWSGEPCQAAPNDAEEDDDVPF